MGCVCVLDGVTNITDGQTNEQGDSRSRIYVHLLDFVHVQCALCSACKWTGNRSADIPLGTYGQNMSGGSSQNWLYVVLDKIGMSKSGKEEANQETKCCAMCMQLPGGHQGGHQGHPGHPSHPANQATEFPLQNPGKAVGGIFTDLWKADFYRCYSICRTHISQISKHIKEMLKLWFCHMCTVAG